MVCCSQAKPDLLTLNISLAIEVPEICNDFYFLYSLLFIPPKKDRVFVRQSESKKVHENYFNSL